MLVSSSGFTDLQTWAAQIHRGLVGSLDDAAGMAGDDDTGHAFATKYDPVAQSVVNALGRAVAQLGGTANGLYTMAVNYTRTEADIAASMMQPEQLPQSSDPQCDDQAKDVQIPTAVGHQNWAVREIIARFWPQGDPDKLRQAGTDWKRLAQLVSRLGTEGDQLAQAVTTSSTASAVDSFATNWRAMHDGCAPSGPLLNTLTSTAYQLGEACETYAKGIDDLRDKLEDLALVAGGVAVAGVALTLFTLGGSDVAAVGGEAAIAAEAGSAALALTAELEASAEVAVLAEAAAVVDAAAARLIPIGVAAAGGLVIAGAGSPGANAAPTPAAPTPGIGPLPPDPSSRYPVLGPGQQQDMRTWMTRMGADGRTSPALGPMGKPKIDARRAYQQRVAGDTEYQLYTDIPDGKGGQKSMNADGVRPEDGAAIDAKYVGTQPSCKSPLRLGNVDEVPDFVYESTMKSQGEEMDKYASAFQDPRNQVNHLEVVTNDDKAAAYYAAMMAAKKVPGETRVVP
ncbi:restriction endonuclease fold toxin-2 domain-containing protein [Kitasatospora sp. NPDC002227]|uniref:restriction endonuclease fold toxin-2 domain-containing protein n=1 Tax=Kitasatospora sp. NPDC002227 TaxID=3154773 RepID=UPI00331A3E39